MTTNNLPSCKAIVPTKAIWNSACDRYETPQGWRSYDGNNWTDDHGSFLDSDEFMDSTIILIRGPRDQQVVS